MKRIFLLTLNSVLIFCGMAAVAEESEKLGVVAEVWPIDLPAASASKLFFEKWRAQNPPAGKEILALDGLNIPVRDANQMVRVAGVIIAPMTGDYAFSIKAPEAHKFLRPNETELWIQDDKTREWRLAQCTGNPNKRSGRTRLVQGVPRRFELWSMGRNQTTVEWEVADFENTDPETGLPKVRLARQIVPANALQARTPTTDDMDGDGLLDSWKKSHSLNETETMGPNGPWGDPDGDGLPNWREQASGTNPKVADVEACKSLVRWELWRDIPGRYVFDLRRTENFPTGPREVRFLDRLEIPTGNGDRYGSRVRGLLVAPVDGEYTFKIVADDSAEFWLGENESWESKRLIARTEQKGAGGPRWTRRNAKGEIVPLYPEQTARVTLRAGTCYYLELLHKQDTSTDYCAVAWVRPNTTQPELITKEYLVSWQPSSTDANDDGLPDEWQRTTGLLDNQVEASMRHAEADPDRDGACNRDEWAAGTNPLVKADAPAGDRMLTSEAWTGIPGHRLGDLTTHSRYPAKPDFVTRVDNLDFGDEGENYGVRMRGYLTAPDDGEYRFAIAGNNSGILYLGESEVKFTKRVIARVEHGTDWRFFSASEPERSGLIRLEKGRRYYIEILFKRGATDPVIRGDEEGHSSVAWTRPGRAESVIDPLYFSPYPSSPGAEDLDDDDLPDEWESLYQLDPSISGGRHGAWGDPDGDGLENFREFRLGLDPKKADVHGKPGLALWEYWDNRGDIMPALRDHGGTLAERLREDTRFPLLPTRREWRESLEAPRAVDVNYASRMRAVVVAPQTGDYVFALSSENAGQLFFSADESKFNRRSIASIKWATRYREWNNEESQMSSPVRLKAGERYYMEALHAKGLNPLRRDHLCVAWKRPGTDAFEVIAGEHLVAFFRDPNDQDDDDLPDDWERKNGLSVENSSADGDLDKDGLTNSEEYLLGTRADLADTDGDGVSDLDESRVYGSDPLVKDAVPPKLHTDFVLDKVISPLGAWLATSDGVLTSTSMRGVAGFKFTVDEPGLYVVRLDARAIGKNGYSPPVPVSAFVDGAEIGDGVVTDAEGGISWITPWLGTGTHEVTIRNRNTRFNVSLKITSLKLFKMVGEDESDGGIPNWYEKIIDPTNSFDHPGVEELAMQISPACIEGTSRKSGAVILDVNGIPCQAMPGIGNAWYANIPLAEKGGTVVEGKFEGGAVTRRLNLVWSAVNPFQIEDQLKVRVGDSMKFAVPGPTPSDPNSRFSLSLDGKEIPSGPSDPEVIVKFAEGGEHILEATRPGASGPETRRITVTAMKADFGPEFSIAAEAPRKWRLPDVPSSLTLDSDAGLRLSSLKPLAPAGLQTTALWKEKSAAQPIVLARLSQGGPILATTRVNVFHLVDAAASGDAHVVKILPDGTRVVEISYLIEGRIPDDFSMWIDFAVTDAVFADGSTRYLLTADDFDESGVARVKIYKAPGTGVAFVCHWNRLFGNDEDSATDPEAEGEEAE